MKVEIDREMQAYFNRNIDLYQRVLDGSWNSLIKRFEAEIAIRVYKHAQRKLDSLQREALKEGDI